MERCKTAELGNTLALCTNLDLRFKMLPFSEEALTVNLKRKEIEMVTPILLERQSVKKKLPLMIKKQQNILIRIKPILM